MRKVWFVHDTVISALGNTTEENYSAIQDGRSGLHRIEDPLLSEKPFYGSRIASLQSGFSETHFESICRKAIAQTLEQIAIPLNKTLLIVSTTKGNIDQLGLANPLRLSLTDSARYLQDHFQFEKSLVVSNACISGVLACIVAKRYLEAGRFDHAVIVGGDVLSRFVVTGFQSLQALSDEPCKPFDADRKGINLGEGAAVIVLSTDQTLLSTSEKIYIAGTGLSNDANHISGPSRTGEELALAIAHSFQESNVTNASIDFVNAHGTGTLYNDEMESKAVTIAKLNETPINSLKGYLGHTLGAAGVMETAIMLASMRHQMSIISRGYNTLGVSHPLHICTTKQKLSLNHVLKTASGFGGCNAAMIMAKA